jgi:hypothetical protein
MRLTTQIVALQLEFVAHKKPVWTCRQCPRESASRGLVQVRLCQWFIAVASSCRRGRGPNKAERGGKGGSRNIVLYHSPLRSSARQCTQNARVA